MKNCSFVALAACALATSLACAADGDLDPTFGVDGVARTMVTTAAGNGAFGPAIDSQGRTLICDSVTDGGPSGSDILVARFTPDGALDANFSFDGKVEIDFDAGEGYDNCRGVAVQSDDKVVLISTTADTSAPEGDIAIARLNEDGTLDDSFGAGTGKVRLSFGLGGPDGDDAGGVAIDAQNRIVIGGTASTAADGLDFAVTRLLPDGSLDAAFNLTGKVSVGFDLPGSASKSDVLAALALDDEGRILLVGSADTSSDVSQPSADFAIARVLANGQLDPNFDADGRKTVAFDLGGGNDDEAFAVAVLHDGGIILVGAADTSTVVGTTNYSMAAVRMRPDGSLDSDFGIGGKTLVPFDLVPNGTEVAFGVIEQADGKVILSGYAQHDVSAIDAATVRLNVDGSLDGGWGAFGKKTYDFGLTAPSAQLFRGIASFGGRIVVSGGFAIGPSQVDDFVAAIEDDLIFASSFE